MKALNWCETYVDGRISCKELASEIVGKTGALIVFTNGFSRWSLELDNASISVERNDDASWWSKRRADGFLYYPLKVSAEQKEAAHPLEYESLMTEIASHIRQLGLRVSAVADFPIEGS